VDHAGFAAPAVAISQAITPPIGLKARGYSKKPRSDRARTASPLSSGVTPLPLDQRDLGPMLSIDAAGRRP